jgi:hypothetical protein
MDMEELGISKKSRFFAECYYLNQLGNKVGERDEGTGRRHWYQIMQRRLCIGLLVSPRLWIEVPGFRAVPTQF